MIVKKMNTHGVCNRTLVVLTALTLLAASLLGQERFGNLEGVVTDASGAVLPNVAITARSKTTDRVYTTTSGSSGLYIIRDIEPGRYSMRFTASGFSATEFPDINLLVGKTLKV